MQDVIALVDQARVRSAQLNDELAQRYGVPPGAMPIAGLNMANMHAVIALELLVHYAEIWARLDPAHFPDVDETRRENAQRVLEVTKSAFVLSLSAFEFCAKQALAVSPGRLPPMNGRVYLRRVVRESVVARIIPNEDDHPWEGLIELRNTVVHNNGIAEKTSTYTIPGAAAICFVAGRMTQGNLKFFAEAQLWAVKAFGRWCEGIMR